MTTQTARPAKTETPRHPIQTALSNVMDAVRSVRKTDQNLQQGFKFRGVDAVVNAVGPALRDHGVLVMPEVIDQQYGTVEVGRNRTPMAHVQVKVRYTFTGPAGDSMSCVVVAEAMDSGDKATPKAMSVALRTALLQALCLPTDEPDPDSQTYERSPAIPEPRHEVPTLTVEDIALAKGVAVQAVTCGDVDKIRATWAEADARGYLDVDVTSALNPALAGVVGVSSPVTLKAWLTGVGKWVAANGGMTVQDAANAAQTGAE